MSVFVALASTVSATRVQGLSGCVPHSDMVALRSRSRERLQQARQPATPSSPSSTSSPVNLPPSPSPLTIVTVNDGRRGRMGWISAGTSWTSQQRPVDTAASLATVAKPPPPSTPIEAASGELPGACRGRPSQAKPSQAKQPRARTSPRHGCSARRRTTPITASRRRTTRIAASRRRTTPLPAGAALPSQLKPQTPSDAARRSICHSPTLVAVIAAAVRAARFGAWGGGAAEAADAPHAAHSTSRRRWSRSSGRSPLERSRLV
jgi:hypothetical protein